MGHWTVYFLVLPNSTNFTQEMDQGYKTFKPETDCSDLSVAAMKMVEQVYARGKAEMN